jgi:anti-sigma-K factor RskA
MADEQGGNGAAPDDDAELVELRRLAARVRPGGVAWERPPPGLWERIEAEIAAEPTPGGQPEVVELASRRRARWIGLAAAAAMVVVVVGAIVALGRGNADDEVVAETTLERLGATGSGRAELLDHDGQYRLRLETSDLQDDDGYLELWLIDPSVTKMVSLGPLRADGLYDLPPGVDPSSFPVVDISAEPIDGDPAHSGDSLLRGTLSL